MTCGCGANLEADDVASVEGMCTCCAGEEIRRLRNIAVAARAYVDSRDEDRITEFDALVDALAAAGLPGAAHLQREGQER